ncbi:MAG: glycosyltransferase family 4 protein [Nocardioides sp.]
MTAVTEALARGDASAPVVPAYAALLEVADQHYAHGETKEAAHVFTEALRLATHRVLHFDTLTSPRADARAGSTAPLRDRAGGAAMRAARGRVSTGSTTRDSSATRDGLSARDSSTSRARPVRLLLATRINADFLHEIRDHFGAHPNFEMRFLDFAEAHELDRFAKRPERIVLQTLAGKPRLPEVAEEVFRGHLDWADVVLVEWCTALAALLTQIDPRDTRIVVRMHSYEAFTLWPHLMDMSRVDDMVFVSDHLRDLALAAIPGLQGECAPRPHVITNAVDLERCVRPKTADARFTLGLVGSSKMVKDPRWAIAVLRRLREHDERYRLVLVRGELEEPTEAARAYVEDYRRDRAELEPMGAVQVLGHTDDVPATLQDIGIVLSASARESFHIGFVEGVASGALPVVRDWPFFPGATRQLFPADWTVDSVDEAAERVLRLTDSEPVRREAGAAASELVRSRWDWTVVRQDFERLFTGW